MIDLIIMTGAMRTNNLNKLLQSIKYCENKKNELKLDIHMKWLICYDQFNSNEPIEPFYDKLSNEDIDWVSYKVGKEGQANFGGDLFNDALTDLLHGCYEGKDPWVYVLDDDNILSIKVLTEIQSLENSENNGKKKIIWMSYLMASGDIQRVTSIEDAFTTFEFNGAWYYRYNPDPSSIIFKGSVFLDFGGWNGGVDYDYTSVRPMCQNNIDCLFLSKDYDLWLYQAYHDGLKRSENIDSVKHIIDSGVSNPCMHVWFGSDEFLDLNGRQYMSKSLSFPVIGNDSMAKILEIIENDYKKIGLL